MFCFQCRGLADFSLRESLSIYVSMLFFCFCFYIYLFIYFWVCWVYIAARRLSLVVASRGYFSLWRGGFSFAVASLVVEHGF